MKNKMRWISMVGWGFIIVGLTKMLLNAIGLPGDSTDPPMYPAWPTPVPIVVETNAVKIDRITTNIWIAGPTIEWMNDAVYYETNHVFDVERTQAITNRYAAYFYTRDVVSTNKVGPWFFGKGDRQVEIGFRSDGVVVWRNRK